MDASEARDLIYSIVSSIPRGSVASYGQIAAMAGLPRHARLVGRAMRDLPDDVDIPWHRVVNASGGISSRRSRSSERDQRRLLEAEGVRFRGARVDMKAHRWNE